jgi:D-cysteine desulfhydrase
VILKREKEDENMNVLGKSPIYQIRDTSGMENELYIMREDLLPFSLGGNKVRIAAEFFLDMEKKGCDTMIAYGNARSNLCRVIANECYIRKIPCYIICSSEEGEEENLETGNSRLMKLLHGKMIGCKKNNIGETVEKVMKMIEKEGHKPYYIYGNKFGTGNEGVSARAYAKAYKEISQFATFDYIFHPSGTGATQAGLICGHILAKDHTIIQGILISSREYQRAVDIIGNGVRSYFEEEGLQWKEDYLEEIHLSGQYTRGGYGKYDREVLSCISREFQENSLTLDPVYTGKAFLGMKDYLIEHKIRHKKILFLHTGGTPLFYDCLNQGQIK